MFYEILPVIVIAIAIAVILILQGMISRNYKYLCSKCGASFSLPFWKSVFSTHSFGSKLVRCPECGQMTGATLVRK